jgi:hypothetical protein
LQYCPTAGEEIARHYRCIGRPKSGFAWSATCTEFILNIDLQVADQHRGAMKRVFRPTVVAEVLLYTIKHFSVAVFFFKSNKVQLFIAGRS